jgi:hypothetical protein
VSQTLLAALPSIMSFLALIGLIYKGSKLVSDQLAAIRDNTKAIQLLTVRIVRVEQGSEKTNLIATDIQEKVTNGHD